MSAMRRHVLEEACVDVVSKHALASQPFSLEVRTFLLGLNLSIKTLSMSQISVADLEFTRPFTLVCNKTCSIGV